MNVDRGMAEVNGARLYYEVAGAGEPVVLIHGFTLDTRMWDQQFAVFAERYRVLRYDARGFGRSDLPGALPYSHADDLHVLLAHLDLMPATLIGLSMGGGIAADVAVAYPEAVCALVLVDAAVGGHVWSAAWQASHALMWERGRASDITTARRLWLDHGLFAPAREQPAVAASLERIVGDYSGWHWVNTNPSRGLQPPAMSQIQRVAAPTLVVVGEHDLPDFHACAECLRRDMSDARLVVLPGAGHMANMETPERFNTVVLEFLSRLPAA